MFNPVVVENVLSKEEIDFILNFARNTDRWGSGGDDFWESRVVHFAQDPIDMPVKALLSDIRKRIQKIIIDHYQIDKIYSDGIHMVRWFDGMEQPPHCDNMENDEIHFENYKHRLYGSILYLNDDFDGGETYYPKDDFYIKPKAGKVAIHPGDEEHWHGVTKINGGIRYTIASFWTEDESHANEW